MELKRPTASFFWLLFLFCILEGVSFGDEICGYHEMGTVEITRGDKVIGEFTITRAVSAECQRQGLMHCVSLDPGLLTRMPDDGFSG